jgi:ribosomal protein S18 acetylase RimI-like enzyme
MQVPEPDGFPTIESMDDALGPAIATQFVTFCRAVLRGPAATHEPGFSRVVTGEPHPLGNFAVFRDPPDPELARRAIEPLRDLSVPSAAIFLEEPPGEVLAAVTEHGYELVESMPAMAADLGALARPDLAAGHELVEVDATLHHEAWNEALALGYEIPGGVAACFGPDAARREPADGALRYFGIVLDGVMVATSALFLEGGLAGIYCVATRPEHRGKGLGAHVTSEPLHRVRAEGYRVGILQSSAMGEPVYRRVGFEPHGVLPLYVRSP